MSHSFALTLTLILLEILGALYVVAHLQQLVPVLLNTTPF